ncbi:MAG: hypothetical protein ACRD1X_11055 [Vicinamibacteria bacterium]
MSKTSMLQTLVMFLTGAPLFGQDRTPGPPIQTLVQNQLESDILVAPDFKLTDLGGDLTGMAGVYGGWLINQKLLIGGGGYFQTNEGDVSDMRYGGAVLEYFVNPSRLVNFSVRGLLGGGTASIQRRFGPFPVFRGRSDPFYGVDFSTINRGHDRPRGFDYPVSNFDKGYFQEVDESFLVAEPEANVTLNVTERFRIGFGGGYRFIGAANGLEDRLDGFTANLAAQFRF